MSLKNNNRFIIAFIVFTLLLAVTIWVLAVSGTRKEYVVYYWNALVVIWFLSLLYGPFARMTSLIFREGSPHTARQTEQNRTFLTLLEAIGARVRK
jgi:hypothetical protein